MMGRFGVYRWMILLAALSLLVAGCGGGSASTNSTEGDAGSAPTRRSAAVATMPSANFSSVGAQSGLTQTTVVTTTAVEEETAGPDLALGERVYTNRCAECHGANGEGGSASAVAGLTTPEEEFIDLLRTGGDLGNDHLFGTRAVSENGIGAMYAYLQSLE